jgi:hypothetical protein
LVGIFARRRFQRDILYVKVTRSRETRHYSRDSTGPVRHSHVCIFCDLTGGALKNGPDQKRKLVISMFTSLDGVEHQWSQILLIMSFSEMHVRAVYFRTPRSFFDDIPLQIINKSNRDSQIFLLHRRQGPSYSAHCQLTALPLS